MTKLQRIWKKKTTLFRHLVQLVCFLFAPSMFIEIFNSIKKIEMNLVHQQGTLTNVLPQILLLSGVMIVTILAGRFFCGWMCSFGAMGDLLYAVAGLVSKKKRVKSLPGEAVWKKIKYVLLAVIVILFWGVQIVALPNGINPWEAFGMLVVPTQWGSLPTSIKMFWPALLILLVIMIASLFIERFFCRYLCPLGAFFSLISKVRILLIGKDSDICGKCRLCTRNCSMALALDHTEEITTGECIQCMKCVEGCPKGNAHTSFIEKRIPAIAAGLICCAIIAAVYGVQTKLASGNVNESNVDQAMLDKLNDSQTGQYKDGTYTGTGTGFRGEIQVEVTVKNGKITEVTILSANDDTSYLNQAVSGVVPEILETQGTEVDAVSGATYSSKGIIAAVENALKNAGGEAEAESTENKDVNEEQNTESVEETPAEDAVVPEENTTSGAFPDGTYTGTGNGFRGATEVTVTVEGGMITSITVDSYQDDAQFFERAEEGVIASIISEQNVNVDAVSGATYSSNGIKEAVANALNMEFTPSEIQNTGHGGRGR